MSWRSIMGAAPAAKPLTHYSHNTQNCAEGGNSADTADIALGGPPVEAAPEPEAPAPLAVPVADPVDGPPDLVEGVARLCEAPMPQAYSPARWARMKADARQLVADHGGTLADAGWKAEDLFSVHPAAPEARQDYKGAVTLINGRAVEAVAPETITLRSPDGSRLTIYRRGPQPGRVMLWELS
jgi:hypothetical protein